jgi:hypothetical protein
MPKLCHHGWENYLNIVSKLFVLYLNFLAERKFTLLHALI